MRKYERGCAGRSGSAGRSPLAASDLVLTAPGLSVIVKAVEESRKIFERMNSYAVYRITETIRIMGFIVLAIVLFNFYPITTIMIVLLALLNDLPIMTIAYDNVRFKPRPVAWYMRMVLSLAVVLGLIGVVSTFGSLLIARYLLNLDIPHIQSFIYLKLVVAGHLTLLVTRTHHPFYTMPYPAPILLATVLLTQTAAACIVGFGLFVPRISWAYVGLIWGYCLVWIFIEDRAKPAFYRRLGVGFENGRGVPGPFWRMLNFGALKESSTIAARRRKKQE